MPFDIRKQRQQSRRVVHKTYAVPGVVHFDGHDMPVAVRHYRTEDLVAQEAFQDGFVYGQAMLVFEQLLFDLSELGSYALSKTLRVTVALSLDAAPVVFEIQAIHPADGEWQACDVALAPAP